MAKPKLLFACADADTIDRFRTGLEECGYKVVSCTRGETAIDLVKEHRFDTAILSINLIGYNGFEICRRLRAIRNDAELPIAIHAPRDSRQWRLTSFESGANIFCFEPILFDRLDGVIRSLLRFKVCLNNSAPIVDAVRALDRAIVDPGEPVASRTFPEEADTSVCLRYLDRLLDSYGLLDQVRIDEACAMLRLVLHTAQRTGSISASLDHLCGILEGTKVAEAIESLRDVYMGGVSAVRFVSETFRYTIEALVLVLGLAERMFGSGEEASLALEHMKAESGYDVHMIESLASVVAADEFLNSIFD